ERDGGPVLLALALLGDDVVAELDALVADVDGGAGDELPDFPLPLPAEGAGEIAVVMAVLPAHVTSSHSLRRGLPAGQPCPSPDVSKFMEGMPGAPESGPTHTFAARPGCGASRRASTSAPGTSPRVATSLREPDVCAS